MRDMASPRKVVATGETPVVPVVGRGVLDAPPSTGETPVVPVGIRPSEEGMT